MSNPITILLVDDHTVVRQGVRAFLETLPDMTVVGEAENGAEAIRLASDSAPDVVLMDLLMPDLDGIEATRRLRQISPRTQVVVLTSHHDDQHIFPALRAGAISYVLKTVKLDDLARAIRLAAAGEAVLDPGVAARVMREIHGNASPSNPVAALTERELEVLKLIAAGLSNADIARKLVVSENTVKAHVSNILSKLHLADRTQAAVLAWRAGVVRNS